MPIGLPSDLGSVVLALCEDLATPRALTVAILLRYSEWDQLATLAIDPKHYLATQHRKFASDARITGLLKKTRDLPTSFDRKAVALSNFWASEKECFRTSVRLDPYLNAPSWGDADRRLGEFFALARKKIRDILGTCPDTGNDRDDFGRPLGVSGKFGPGATFGDRGSRTTVPDKLSSSPTITPAAWPWIFPWHGSAWRDASADAGGVLTFSRGNRFTTVPKDCAKDRGIAIEPSVNVFYQLAYGSAIRRRLLRVGLDLRHAQENHQQLARSASSNGLLGTIDLTNASDTMSWSLVKLLLPPDWFDCLNRLRSPFTQVDGKWVHLRKFSSMGNGFTFELETLIFLSICLAAVELEHGVSMLVIGRDISVFGDDIIVPTQYSKVVLAALRFCGFTPNPKKTFLDGVFRESCGGDFFNGAAARPHQLEDYPNEPQDWISLANGIRRMGFEPVLRSIDPAYLRAWFRALEPIPVAIRKCRGPLELGDIVIHDEAEHWQTRSRSGIRYIRVYRPARFRVLPWSHWKGATVLASAVYGQSSGTFARSWRPDEGRFDRSGVIPRDGVAGYKIGWVPRS